MKGKLVIIGSILLACIAPQAFANEDPTIAIVNGQELKQSTLQFYALERRQIDSKNNVPMNQLVDDIVNMQLLKEEAHKNKLDKSSDFKARILKSL